MLIGNAITLFKWLMAVTDIDQSSNNATITERCIDARMLHWNTFLCQSFHASKQDTAAILNLKSHVFTSNEYNYIWRKRKTWIMKLTNTDNAPNGADQVDWNHANWVVNLQPAKDVICGWCAERSHTSNDESFPWGTDCADGCNGPINQAFSQCHSASHMDMYSTN